MMHFFTIFILYTNLTIVQDTIPIDFAYLSDDMVFIEGGEFLIGDVFAEGGTGSDPVHRVSIFSFFINRYEVTNEQFCIFLNEEGNQFEDGVAWVNIENGFGDIELVGTKFQPKTEKKDHPVVEVNWYGANAYCRWLSKKTGKKLRLPTESEWEFASREQGKKIRFGNGKDIANPQEMNFCCFFKHSYSISCKVNGAFTLPVNHFLPNSLGLYNMSGNVDEICMDFRIYTESPQINPIGSLSEHVTRGGSCGDSAYNARCTARHIRNHNHSGSYTGFRIASIFNGQRSFF